MKMLEQVKVKCQLIETYAEDGAYIIALNRARDLVAMLEGHIEYLNKSAVEFSTMPTKRG